MQSKYYLKVSVLFVVLMLVSTAIWASPADLVTESGEGARFLFWAFLLGGISAISLVFGALLGLIWQPGARVNAAFTAYGAGALLAALSVELIAPTVIDFVNQGKASSGDGGMSEMTLSFIYLIGGCVIGGVVFYFLNEALDSQGGYLRKVSTTISYFGHMRKSRLHRAIKRLSKISVFRNVPSTHLDIMVQMLKYVSYKPGKILMTKGSMISRIYIIDSGEVEAADENGRSVIYGPGSFLGETAFLLHIPANYTATVKSEIKVFELTQHDFFHLREACPELMEIIEKEAEHELMHDIHEQTAHPDIHQEAEEWCADASSHVHTSPFVPTQAEINQAAEKLNSAPLSIWLGMFLDGLPESFVIGAGFLILLSAKMAHGAVSFTDVIPYTLIAGLFISNFPESMSSSIGMKKMGWKSMKIFLLWISLLMMTALGAMAGYYYGSLVPEHIEIGIEGLAAGAMLTMIAQTMIPEAVHIGGNKVTGLSTLAGYLSAVAFKVLE
jgi:zinc transporter ZupT